MRIIRFTQQDDQDKTVVALSFKSLSDLVDQNDPSPFSSKEITQVAEDAIANHVSDLPVNRNVELNIRLPEKNLNPEAQAQLPVTIRQHFTIRATEITLELKRKKQGVMFGLKLIVTTVAITILVAGILRNIQELTSIEQSIILGILTILNWAAIWDTFEAYIIDYRGLARKRRIYAKIARIQIQLAIEH
jgi:hypothetical protein